MKLIHISTDAVFLGSDEAYYEDHTCDGMGDYALSKIIGEVDAPGALNLRCSLIGHEVNRSRNLLEWVLSRRTGETIQGYTNHIWNGVTTLQLSEFIYKILCSDLFDEIRSKTPVLNYSPNIPVSKYNLLKIFKEVYQKDISIEPHETKDGIRRILNSRFSHFYMEDGRKRTMADEVERMKHYHEKVRME
ncbi:hypothetical protein EG832_13535 [bacterium]|nr:hypothetical protein [bacterium]